MLTFYANGTSLAAIAPLAAQWRQAARRTVTLARCDDFPKHFLISAVLAAEAGTPLADAVGPYKEVDDSRGGSGSSFNDIAADRAGTRFGEMAPQSLERARKFAPAIASGVKESDFMPMSAICPNSCRKQNSYGAMAASAHRRNNKMMAGIEARVASRPLLR
jgi:hypothetical protein